MKDMNCLSDELVQRWIDKELSSGEAVELKAHLQTCAECRYRVQEQEQLATKLKQLIAGPAQTGSSIPPFIYPVEPATRKKKKLTNWLRVAAVMLPLILLLKIFTNKEEVYQPTREQQLMYESFNDMDANSAFQERLMVTTSTNQEGELLDIEIQ
jgi:predicted anti-sigma-YlaC factor YlaD